MGERISSTSQQRVRFSDRIDAPLPDTFSWKGTTIKQPVSAMQKNGSILTYDSASNYKNIGPNVLLPQPIKHYRREFASTTIKYPTQPRSLVSIDELNRPGGNHTIPIGGYTPSDAKSLDKFVVHGKDAGGVNNKTEHPGQCNAGTGPCLDRASQARRRVRTSGIVKSSYNYNTRQYLNNRNKSFEQNSFQFFQNGNSSAIPGSPDAISNTYRTQSYMNATSALYDTSGCNPPVTNMYYKPNNWKFSQQGAADASTFMLRRKFDTITNNTAVFRRVYGNQVASAMSYGIANSVYTYKDKIGYPLPKRPRIRPESTPTCCTDTHIAGGMRVNDVPV